MSVRASIKRYVDNLQASMPNVHRTDLIMTVDFQLRAITGLTMADIIAMDQPSEPKPEPKPEVENAVVPEFDGDALSAAFGGELGNLLGNLTASEMAS